MSGESRYAIPARTVGALPPVGRLLVFALVGDRNRERTGHIVVTPGHLEHLLVSFTRTWQRPPTAPELAGLIEDYSMTL